MTKRPTVDVVDVSDRLKTASRTWMIAQAPRFAGRDLRGLENEIAKELGIAWPVYFGCEMQGVYERPEDCASVAVGMMRKRPDLQLAVTCSDPQFPAFNVVTGRFAMQ